MCVFHNSGAVKLKRWSKNPRACNYHFYFSTLSNPTLVTLEKKELGEGYASTHICRLVLFFVFLLVGQRTRKPVNTKLIKTFRA